MSRTSSASSSSASTTSSKCGGMSTTTKSNIVRSIRTMPIISSAVIALAGRGLDRRAEHAQRRRLVRREEAVHQLRVDGLDDRGRVGRRVLRRYAEQHGVVTELEVGVDERDPPGVARREQHREVGRDDALADAALGRERDEDLARAAPARRAAAAAVDDARHRLADPLDRLADLALAGVDRERVAHAGAQRVLEQRERELVGEQHDADLGEAPRDALHRGEPVGRRPGSGRTPRRSARRARAPA